jgi:thiol-disulfide isomerase/thioredoxin
MTNSRITLAVFVLLLIYSCSQRPANLFERDYADLNNAKTSIESFKDNTHTIFVAFANDCPVCKASIPTLRKINEQFPDVGVVLFYPANQRDSSINAFIASLLPSSTVCVKDKNKFLTKKLGATVTPHAFIVDSEGSVVYRGAINNGVFTNYRKNYAQRESFLLNALDTLIHLEKKLIKHETKVVGCYIE